MTEETPSATTPATAAEPAEEKKPLTEAEWAQIVDLWELGEITLEELSDKFKITTGGLSKGLKKRGATKGAKAKAIAAAAAVAAAAAAVTGAVDAAAERKKKIEETKRDHYNWSTTIAKLAMKELIECQRALPAAKPFATADANLRALRRAMAILERSRMERYAILDAAGEIDEKELPALRIENLTDEEIQKLRKAGEEDDLEVEIPPELGDEVVVETD